MRGPAFLRQNVVTAILILLQIKKRSDSRKIKLALIMPWVIGIKYHFKLWTSHPSDESDVFCHRRILWAGMGAFQHLYPPGQFWLIQTMVLKAFLSIKAYHTSLKRELNSTPKSSPNFCKWLTSRKYYRANCDRPSPIYIVISAEKYWLGFPRLIGRKTYW